MRKLGYSLVLFMILVIASGMILETTGGLGAAASPDQARPQPIPRQTLNTPQWQQLSPTADPTDGSPAARYNHAMVYHQGNNSVYLFGGQAGGSYFNDVWALNLDTLTWDRLFANTSGAANTAFPVQRRMAVMAVDDAGQNLYIATGQASDDANHNDIWRFALSTNSWTKLSSTSNPGIRYGAPGGTLGGNLLVSHGFGASNPPRYDDTWLFNINTEQWQDISPSGTKPVGRCLLDGAAVGDKFVIHGGQSGPIDQDPYRADTWILNTTAGTWSEIATGGSEGVSKPDGRRFQSLVGYEAENGALLFGGVGESSTLFNDVWFLDIGLGTWSELAPTGTVPTARRSQSAVWIAGNSSLAAGMLLFGGTIAANENADNARSDLWLLTFPEPGAPGNLQFSAGAFEVPELGGNATISVTRTGGVSGTVTVDYTTSNGTAIAGQDYLTQTGTLTFNNGSALPQTFSVPIIDDSDPDGNKTVNLSLTNPTGGATLGNPSTALLTILDDETGGSQPLDKFIYLPLVLKLAAEEPIPGEHDADLSLDDIFPE